MIFPGTPFLTCIPVFVVLANAKFLLANPGSLRRTPRACGVIFQAAYGFLHTALLRGHSKNEIILSAGPLGSPKLLLLSGIGPPHHLSAQGIGDYESFLNKPKFVLPEQVRMPLRLISFTSFESFSKFRYKGMSVESLIKLVVNLPMNFRARHANATISLEQFYKETVTTIWQYHGGCQVVRVFDRDYGVSGVVGLRVIDGSTLLQLTGTNPQATVMMLGRYMGRRILDDRLSSVSK